MNKKEYIKLIREARLELSKLRQQARITKRWSPLIRMQEDFLKKSLKNYINYGVKF